MSVQTSAWYADLAYEHIAQKLWDFRFTSAAHEKCFFLFSNVNNWRWTVQPSALTYTNHRNIDSEFSSQHARSKLSHCRRDSEESIMNRLAVVLSCVSWKEVQWFSMEERLTPGVLWAATCECFRGLQGWKTRVGWETWLCFTLVLQELPAVKVYVSVAEGLRHYADVYMDFLLSYPLQLLTEFLPLYILLYIFAHCCFQFVLFWKHLTFSFCLRRYAMKNYFWRKALTY